MPAQISSRTEAEIASAKAHYQRSVQAYLLAATPEERARRGKAMQRALNATLDARYRRR